MSNNKPGYTRIYFNRCRAEIVTELLFRGSCCEHATLYNAEIHHVEPLNGIRPNGRLQRLTEWRKNMHNLEALCPDCHRFIHSNKEWYER